MSIKFRKQSAAAVPTPEGPYIQLFVDVDGQPKVKDNAGQVIPLAQASTLTLTEQPTAPEPAPDTIKLYAKDVGGKTELFIKDGTGEEIQVTSDGTMVGASGGLMPHPGFFGNPAIGEFSASEGDLVTLPSGAHVGDRAGVFAIEASDVRPPSGQLLLWGALSVTGPAHISLKAGAYAEWVFCELEPDLFGWVPSGASNEESAGAPLAYRPAGNPVLPNEWVLSSDHDDEVSLPVAPQHGDSFAVLVDNADDGCTLTPAAGATLYNAIGNNFVIGPDPLAVAGPSYYEWIWNDNAGEWLPRQNTFSLRPAAVLNAIVGAPLDTISFGNKWLGGVSSPLNADQAATKGYVDSAVAPLGQTVVLTTSVPLSGVLTTITPFTFPISTPSAYYAFEFHLTIESTASGFVGVTVQGDVTPNFFVQNATLAGSATQVTYVSNRFSGSPLADSTARVAGIFETTVTGGFRAFTTNPPTIPLVLRAQGNAGTTTILPGSWGRVWKA